MAKSNSKVFYKGHHHDFLVLAESSGQYEKYIHQQNDPKQANTIPISDVIAGQVKIFTTENGRGSEGVLHEASKFELENEFGKGKHVDEIVEHILKEGDLKSGGVNASRKSWSSTNDSHGAGFQS
ncbi:hypothetical protein WICPIJ_008594 [Wickerhamomyces pijperi]|uniref:Ribosome maturation protein SDO1/SBDS N-terminal domain-containing protein n=1 Tax=Wickerhamomyces pijperi TaxID=599730 RepID=A0A9P8THZ7_WICPI|nr:hypothetical protein WICPIJ_008594 [Wickerhamomyces pijperi]